MSSLIERFGRKAPVGEVLFREDDRGVEMFVLQAGKVRLTRKVRGKETVLADLGPGEFFGEMAILNNKPRSATAVVAEDAQLLVIDPKTFEAMIKANTEIAVRMIKKLARRLDDANEQIETLLLRDANSRVVHCLINSVRAGAEPVDGGVQVHLGMQEIVSRTGLEESQVESVLERMARSGLLNRGEGVFTFGDVAKLEEFLEFLEMKERFGGMEAKLT